MACRKKVLGVCVDFVVDSVTNPGRLIKNATGINTTVSIGGKRIDLTPGTDNLVKQARASLKDVKKQSSASLADLKKAGRQAEINWNNLSRGEVGKYIAKTGEGLYGVTMTIPRAIQSGNWSKELQRGYGNSRMALSPIENMIGENKGWQDKLRNDKGWNAWTLGTAKNFAGQTHGHATMQSSGTISNADRVQWQQLSVKAAAVVAAIFGGAAVAGAYSGSGSAAGAGAAGAGSSAAGAGSAGLTLPTLGSSAGYGASASYGLGSTVVGTGAGAGASLTGGAAAATGTSWWATGLGSLAGGIGTGVASSYLNRGVAAATDGATNYLDDLLGIGNGGTENVTPYPQPTYYSDPTGNAGSYGGDNVSDSIVGLSPLGIAALALTAFAVYKAVKK